MAVVEARFLYLSQAQAGTLSSSYTAHYQVETNDPADQCITVREALPALGTAMAFGNDSSPAVAIDYGAITPQEWKSSRHIWSAEVNYSTSRPPGWKGGSIEIDRHPSEDPPEIEFQGEQIQIAIDKDKDGADILNGAGDPFDDLEKDWARGVLTINVNKRATVIDHATEDATQNKINDAIFFGKPVGTWKCESVGRKLVYYDEGEDYYRCSYMFRYDSRGWSLVLVDQGSRDINGKLPTDAAGAKFGGKVPLTNAGAFLTQGDPLEFVTAVVYESTNFPIALQLPADYPA